tara:strand:- start:77 stop:547 length:471 start_codon:yes stop_codon:yes gene_type:complete
MSKKELLTDDIIIDALSDDGIMEEPDAPWLFEYITTEYGGELDTTTNWCDKDHMLKIYSESTADGYDIYWCTHDERPYVSNDGYQYEDYAEWSSQTIDELTAGSCVWIEPHLWNDMEYDFNHELEQWWTDVYDELFNDKKDELLDSGDYYEDKKEK